MPGNICAPPELWGPWFVYELCFQLIHMHAPVILSVHSRREGSKKEQILLDWNDIAERYGYVHVGTCRVSPDHTYLAYTIDVTGNEQFVLQIKDLRNDRVLPTLGVEGVVSVEWAQDSCSFFYTLSDQNQRPYRVDCVKLGSDSVHNVPLFVENDSSLCVDIASTKDRNFITVNSNSRTSFEARNWLYHQCDQFANWNSKFCKHVAGVQYFLEHHHVFFYVLTNSHKVGDGSPLSGGYYLARCSVENLQSTYLQNIIDPGRDIFIQDMDMFNEHLVLFLNKEGSSSICSVDMRTIINCEEQMKIGELKPWFFPLPSDMCAIAPGSNHNFTRSVYRAVVSSPVMPDVIVDYDMSRRMFSVIQQEEVINVSHNTKYRSNNGERSRNEFLDTPLKKEHNIQNIQVQKWSDFAEIYSCQEKEVISHDGARIPITILFSRKAHKKGQSPGFLHGCGAYGEVLDKSWCADRLSLLDRGWVIADVRVGVWEAAKWVAKIRDKTCNWCSFSVILHTNMSGGHFGESGRFGQCEEAAYEYSFLMKVLGES
ncbi:unnamed protein product [Withania somnifera]